MLEEKQNDFNINLPDKLPFLKSICWQIRDIKRLNFKEMLGLYEDGWHYLGVLGEPSPEELRFIKQLIQHYGSWLANDV